MDIRHSHAPTSDNQVVFEGNSHVKKIVLNRPRKLNCLSHHMLSEMTRELYKYENDSVVELVIIKGNGKAFSAGGDLRSTYFCAVLGHWSYAGHFYRKQLVLDYIIATYTKPTVAIADGIVMGGGAGLSMFGRFRIVTENTVFAMPEASVGLIADVGASYFLSRLPGFFGEYLGLTGARLNGHQMVTCGLATHFVHTKDILSLESALVEQASLTMSTISEIISKFARKELVKSETVFFMMETINKCFSRRTVEEILESLEAESKKRNDKWILEALDSMRSACPLSLKIFLKSIREGRVQGLEKCLIREYTIMGHLLKKSVSDDFYEGIRAKILDKDNKPKWNPPKLELVSNAMVDVFFSEVSEDDYGPLNLPARSTAVDSLKPKL